MTKKNFDEPKFFWIIYIFFIKASLVLVFNVNILANIKLMVELPTHIIKVQN